MLEVLDGAAGRRWADVALAAMAAASATIDALNVYPVPDGDTGTNLHLTLQQARDALDRLDDDAPLGEVSDVFARGALLGARGNSGIITAQLLRGWADELSGRHDAGADVARRAFVHADAEAWEAVADPVEGTMLSVTRAAAGAAEATAGDLAAVVTAAASAARTALAATPTQLAVLADAGVVDAGGAGIVVLLDALVAVVTGVATDEPVAASPSPPTAGARPGAADCAVDDGPAYEVMFLLDAGDLDASGGSVATALRARLGELGDSVVVTGGAGLWHAHVHSDDPGAVVEAAVAAGHPHQVRISYLPAQVEQAQRPARDAVTTAVPPRRTGLVAYAAGPGLAALFEAAGVHPVRSTRGRRASTDEVLRAIRGASADAVVVLPNDPDTLAVTEAAARVAREEGLRVTVVPTRAQVQGLAAAAVHDPARDVELDVVAMSAAAGSTRHGAVTVASKDAITSAGPCRAGDVLGVVDGDFAVVGSALADVAWEVVARLLAGGGELVTLVLGEGAAPEIAEHVGHRVRRERPAVEVHVLTGGQPRYPLLVGVE